jgi:predicted PurR-regulated permease PerM
MDEKRITQLLKDYKRKHQAGKRALIIAVVAAIVIGEALLVRAITGTSERINLAASLFTADALLLAAWQWLAQRRETTLESYFTRLDVPNNRRLSYYEQLVNYSAEISNEALVAILQQFYVFYIYAEIDNLLYAMTKYVNEGISRDLVDRAARTFVSRCEQSQDFRRYVCVLVRNSGYPLKFEALVNELAAACRSEDASAESADQLSHPMQYNELDILRQLKDLKK